MPDTARLRVSQCTLPRLLDGVPTAANYSPDSAKQMNNAYTRQSSLILYFFNAAGRTFQHGSSSVTLKLCAAFAAASRARSRSRVDTTPWGLVGLVFDPDVADVLFDNVPALLFCVRAVDAPRVILTAALLEALAELSVELEARREAGRAWMGTGFEPVPVPFVPFVV